jgi:hypothetical protein
VLSWKDFCFDNRKDAMIDIMRVNLTSNMFLSNLMTSWSNMLMYNG